MMISDQIVKQISIQQRSSEREQPVSKLEKQITQASRKATVRLIPYSFSYYMEGQWLI
ncbi:unnamed protein product [Acanthoscelides obtectus]|uniref:Uncharacterized protein n=1 Tax=Acanthoscelides obtectus TaxID=200917 RepID=A0A9P0M0I9_ACAOB|nr:unnamed protein product [Acanthoscelides obtectus]CAK1622437.1 hypothetical protein AOBTE_LOCUS1481 [Acanthoscelides obtectus]